MCGGCVCVYIEATDQCGHMYDINYSKNKNIQEHHLLCNNNESSLIGLSVGQFPVWKSGKILCIASLIISFSLFSFPGSPIIHILYFLFSSLSYLLNFFALILRKLSQLYSLTLKLLFLFYPCNYNFQESFSVHQLFFFIASCFINVVYSPIFQGILIIVF